MKRISLLLFFLTLFVYFTDAKAGLKNWLDDSIITTERGGTVDADDRRIYFGGGVRVKTPTVNFQPFQVTSPSIKAGCGGIDITFGAFSYFNKEYLVNFLKAVSKQAPAFAFQTAVQTLCPQCAQLMTKLTQLSNAINGLNFNSCQAAQLVGGKVGNWVGGNLNKTLGVGTTGPDWLKSFNDKLGNVTEFINNDVKNLLNSDGCNTSTRGCPANFLYDENYKSLIPYVLADNSYLSGGTGFEKVLRSLIGDIVKKGTTGKDKIKLSYVMPTATEEHIKRILKGIALGDGTCASNSWTYDEALNEDGTYTSATVNTICYFVKANVEGIINKIKTRQPLTNQELQFLSLYNIPAYQIFNTLSLQPGALDGAKDELIYYLSLELAYELLSEAISMFSNMETKLINASGDKIVPINGENIFKMYENQSKVLQLANEFVYKSQKSFQEKIRIYFDVQRLKGMLMANLARHPIMDSRLYSQSLLGF